MAPVGKKKPHYVTGSCVFHIFYQWEAFTTLDHIGKNRCFRANHTFVYVMACLYAFAHHLCKIYIHVCLHKLPATDCLCSKPSRLLCTKSLHAQNVAKSKHADTCALRDIQAAGYQSHWRMLKAAVIPR